MKRLVKKAYKPMTIGKFVAQHDTVGHTLYRKGKTGADAKNPGEETLVLVGHYPTLETLLVAIPEKALLHSNWETLQDVKNIILKYKRLIQQSLNGNGIVRP